MQVLLCLQFSIASCIFTQCNVIFFLFYFFPFPCLFLFFISSTMSIANEVVGKKFCNEGFVRGNDFEILKERLLASFSLPNDFFDLHI